MDNVTTAGHFGVSGDLRKGALSWCCLQLTTGPVINPNHASLSAAQTLVSAAAGSPRHMPWLPDLCLPLLLRILCRAQCAPPVKECIAVQFLLVEAAHGWHDAPTLAT